MSPRVLVSGLVLGQPMGGVRRHNAELLPRVARRLAEAGGGLALLTGRDPPDFELPPEVERIESDVPSRPALVRATREGAALERAVRAAAERGRAFDLIHTAHLPVPRGLPLPFTLTVHDLRSLTLEHTPFSRRLFGRHVIGSAVRRAQAVITVSETVRADLVQRFDLDAERVTVVPNAADHFTPLARRAAPNAADQGAPLVCIGHVERRKNLELVVRALARDPGLPDALFAGAHKGDERARLERLAGELGVAQRIRFHGPFDDAALPALLAEAACVVLPSRLEGFGIPALEAQRARVPLAVAAARGSALVEVAGDSVPSFDPDGPDSTGACVRAIRRACASSDAELDAARRNADRYAWERSAEIWFELWQRVAQTLGKPHGTG